MTANKAVLVIGPLAPGQLAASYARAFARLGHEVVRFDSDQAYFEAGAFAHHRVLRRLFRRRYWDRMNAATLATVERVRPALVFALKGTYLHAETIRQVRSDLGTPIVNYYADNPYCGVPWNPRLPSAQRRDLIAVLRQYTRVWIWGPGIAARLTRDGVAAGFLPFGVDSDVYRPTPAAGCVECGVRHPVVFVGQHSDKREAHVAAIRDHAVALWGTRWGRAAGRLGGRHRLHRASAFAETCAGLYASAEVAFNIVDDLNMPGHNMRTFEIPGAGGLMLATYTAEQAALFPEGEAALYYRSPEELDARIASVIADPAGAQRMRRCAAEIAARHDYIERARAVLADVE